MTELSVTYIHPVLQELALPLPLTTEASWVLTRNMAPGESREQFRITLEDGGDLIMELDGNGLAGCRYVFDEAGQLVSLHQAQAGVDPWLQTLRAHVLDRIRERCTLHATQI